MNWNKPFNLVMEIKREYVKRFGAIDVYNFESWIEKLNVKKYNEVFDCLQFNQENEFLLIRYGIAEMQQGMWEDSDSIYRECRSIVIDLKKEQIVIAPFRKFFNLNEVSENDENILLEKIKDAESVEISDKMDGSMQSARWYNDDIFMCGSMAISKDNSWRLADGYDRLTFNQMEMIRENPNLTFIFEYISLKDAHVIIYNEDDEGLYLIGVRDITDGREWSYKEIEEISTLYNSPMTKLENEKTLQELINLSNELESTDKEGWVLNIDGHKVKIKCDDYVKIHRLLDKVSSVNVIIEAIADNKYDDLISKVPKSYRDRVEYVAKQVFEYKRTTEDFAKSLCEEGIKRSNTRKDYMILIDKCEISPSVKGLARELYLGNSINALKTKNRYKRSSEIGIKMEEI